MLYVRTLRIHPDKVDLLRDWMTQLSERADEVRETFAQEGVRHEQAHLLHTSDGALLIYAVEAEDIDEALRVYEASTLPIDAEHRAMMAAVTAERLDLEPLLDLRAR
jgi:hypothetical protein